jgi:hypothetical protein
MPQVSRPGDYENDVSAFDAFPQRSPPAGVGGFDFGFFMHHSG